MIKPEAEDIKGLQFDFCKWDFRKMPDDPIEFPSPADDAIGQFGEESSIKGGKISVALK